MDKYQACHPEFIEGLSKPYNHPSSRLGRDQGDSVILMSNWYNLVSLGTTTSAWVCYSSRIKTLLPTLNTGSPISNVSPFSMN